MTIPRWRKPWVTRSAYVTAVVRGKEDEHHERARQLDLLFEEFDD